MNTDNIKLKLSNCSCDICQCFNNKLQSKPYTHMKCKLNDRVKLWNKYNGTVKFIGPIQFKHNINILLIGIELDSYISRYTLNNYNLYCDQMKRILVPSTFITLLSPGRRGHPQIKHFTMNPNYKLIQKNRELYKTIDPILYQLIFQR
ncbi:unnamed protein product [Schistosoma rodhaini]|uniref:Uncharacterized protein n=1 Tax=Schistosoma rodhaini TaxID=6188 RepID=A0AA85GBZ1_9TREM|nr:unnamed protein product [Schistosoma rodhaini]